MPPRPTITQNADVRFLGKHLGDVIRAHGGEVLFQRIEAIRAASVDRYRGIANPRGLGAGLETLSLDETVSFVRSFMLFSMLANLAEDRQGAAAEEGNTLASALQLLSAQGVETAEAAALLDRALIAPVLTAHPTEVMRKSMLDHRNRIASLMRRRSRCYGKRGRCGGRGCMWRTKSIRR
jgi:phosphoenolpyruvate carboxylase